MALESTEQELLKVIWSWLSKDDILPKTVGAIVVGGCRDKGLAARASGLYLSGHAPLIVISGYAQPDMEISEAAMLSAAMIEKGVPKSAILIDETASNTGANIVQSANILKNEVQEDITLIHKPYMSRRFFATACAQWPSPQPRFYATHEQIDFETYCERQGKEEVIWKMLGDFKRMDEYAKNGFQIKQTASADVQKAYHALMNRGYTTR